MAVIQVQTTAWFKSYGGTLREVCLNKSMQTLIRNANTVKKRGPEFLRSNAKL